MKRLFLTLKTGFLASLLALALVSCTPSTADLLNLGGGVGNLIDPNLVPRLPSLNDLFASTPVSTSFEDGYSSVILSPERTGTDFINLASMPRTADGGFIVSAGLYALEAESFCLKAGTHAPSGGDGYVAGPLLGDKEAIVHKILANYARNGSVSQGSVQVLLWSIIARTSYQDMPLSMQATANALLSPEEIFELSGGALGLIPDAAWYQLEAQIPAEIRQVYAAEQEIRNLVQQVNSSYADFEAAAFLLGAAPLNTMIRNVGRDEWTRHPDGYYIRYLPYSYKNTRVEIFIEDIASGIADAEAIAEHIIHLSDTVAIPANTSSQRLGIYTPAY